jgi:hypothetical protein
MARMDSGPHLHPAGYGTWVSEKRYEKSDCFKENDGDSEVTMARIWWLDLLARARTRDLKSFDEQMAQLQRDLNRDVWLPERYDANGNGAHNPYYHEYPEVFAASLRQIRYGVRLTPRTLSVHPFGVSRFVLPLGDLRVEFSPERVVLHIPGKETRSIEISGLSKGKTYITSTGRKLKASEEGTVRFEAAGETAVTLTRIS